MESFNRFMPIGHCEAIHAMLVQHLGQSISQSRIELLGQNLAEYSANQCREASRDSANEIAELMKNFETSRQQLEAKKD